MLIFAVSAGGGAGRTVSACNLAYRLALHGDDVAYVDFDLETPQAGGVFEIPGAERGVRDRGVQSYLVDRIDPGALDVAAHSDRDALREHTPGAGRLVLFPGDRGGRSLDRSVETFQRCTTLFLKLAHEYDVTVVDVAAGSSLALELVLTVLARPELAWVRTRWLVFHRWTRQHVVNAGELMNGPRGILEFGVSGGHDGEQLYSSMRTVRTAVADAVSVGGAPPRLEVEMWLRAYHQRLQELADRTRLLRGRVIGEIPFEPLLQWREQIVCDSDVTDLHIANEATAKAFEALANAVVGDDAWRMP